MPRAGRIVAAALVVVMGGSAAAGVFPAPSAEAPAYAAEASSAASAPMIGDFDADGRADLFWYAPGGADDHLWFGTADRAFSGRRVTVAGRYEPLLGDFDGSGTADVLWYGAGDNPDYLWRGRPDQSFAGRSVTVGGIYQPFVGDFDGDGRDDVFWYGDGTRDVLWYGTSGGSFSGVATDTAGSYQPLVGDFDGSGTDDVAWYGAGPAADYLWRGRPDRTFSGRALTVSGTFAPLVGDVDGNRRDDIVWHRDDGNDVIWSGRAGGGFVGSPLTEPVGTTPFLGDFDGAGGDDLFWYAAGATPDEVWLGRAGPEFAVRAVAVQGAYEPVVGDMDGDRRDDVFWYAAGDPPDRLWFAAGNGTFSARLTTLDLAPPPALPLRQETLDSQYTPFGFVAHAMGPTPPAADGEMLGYTNTREAFDKNYARGFRVFEVDWVRLADGSMLAAHDGTESAFGLPAGTRFGDAIRSQTGSTFRSHGTNFTALYAEDAVQLLRDHPDVYLILDSKTAHLDVFRRFVELADDDPAIMERVLPHVAGQGNLDALRRIYPLRNYVLALYRTQARNRFDDDAVVDFVRRNRTPAVMMWWNERDPSLSLLANMAEHRRYTAAFVSRLRAAGAIVYVHSLSSVSRIQGFQAQGIGVYSDGPFPPFTAADQDTAIPEIDSNEPPA